MAKTTAVIDGDSSGLVGALDEGKKGMQKMEAEGKKLSDQLREVTDSVDKAAGAMVQKIGGPKAIGALAGASAAITGAKMAADFFLNSVEKLFKSMGDEGMKVWNDVEKALDSVSGAFAKAVLGGGSAEEMGKKLITVFEGLAKIVEALVTYGMPTLKLAFEGLAIAMKAVNELAKEAPPQFDAMKRAQDNFANATSKANIDSLTASYAALQTKVQGLVGDQTSLALTANDQAQAELRASQALFKKVGDTIRDLEIRKQVEKSRDVLMRQVEAEVANLDFSKFGVAWKIERDREMAERMATKTAELYSSVAKQFAEQGRDAYSFMPEALQVQFDDAEASLMDLEERWDQLYNVYLGKPMEPPKPEGGTKTVKSPEDDPVAMAIKQAQTRTEEAMKATEVQLHAMERLFGMKPLEKIDFFTSLHDGVVAVVDGVQAAKDAWDGLVNNVQTGNQAIQESNEVTLTAEQQAQKANYDQFVNQNAKMVAVSLAGGAKMADVARAAIGNIVSALGDKAMAEAGLMFATGNIAGAAALTAAGAAAYATAAFLGATDKKSGSSTKATTKEAPTVTNNTSFNLQIDAAFADEESIARSFSKAQALARARHMTPYAMT